ncbi:ABC transporter ATP-binding protein [Nocardia nova]|uniref:ABC transporter ATP-binding protein n=1 Tax=Nocardia nova TaxID=37330 RepID=A0A2S6AN40_9NOCA|nr:ATP-binding cassette domain-containing protein [Nocardia nova]PPJ25732.1 ABC transporter ATP-binding protein [Nocardia nova]PPJ36640.1 ABC transporter ATP-binding protein [Nocardia nova]
MTTVLECAAVDAGYSKGRPCVRGFDLTLAEGEVLCLLGPNGAGKTTLLMTLAGLLPGLGGAISIAGTSVKPGQARASSRAGLVLVPDDRSLFTGLSVKQNLALARKRSGPAVTDILDYFPRLGERLDVSAGMLSGGEQQMLAIGRALMQQPKVLLIDELSMGLAPVIVESLLPVIRRVADDKGTAVILVEQHVRLALEIADTAIVLAHGRDVLRGSATELAADPEQIEHAYLGEAVTVAGA